MSLPGSISHRALIHHVFGEGGDGSGGGVLSRGNKYRSVRSTVCRIPRRAIGLILAAMIAVLLCILLLCDTSSKDLG